MVCITKDSHLPSMPVTSSFLFLISLSMILLFPMVPTITAFCSFVGYSNLGCCSCNLAYVVAEVGSSPSYAFIVG